MGRSVSYPTGAVVSFENIEEWDDWTWDDLVYDFRQHLPTIFPSAESADEWLDREDYAAAENGHAYFGLSTYGGLVAYWMVAKEWDGYGPDTQALHDRWVAQAANKFTAAFGSLRKVGVFSNGGGIYERRDGQPVGPDQFDTSPITINGLLTDG